MTDWQASPNWHPAVLSGAVLHVVALIGTGASGAKAEAVTDGTTGPVQSLSGDFTIPAAFGEQTGANLFHSFERFHIRTGESATFTGPGGISHVISRVTGPEASDIDGALRSLIPGADLFLINPNGILFGANAQLDVQGGFHVATADEVRFADGARFRATSPNAGTFTAAAPEAFGFIGESPGPIELSDGSLGVPDGEAVTLAGGELTIAGTAGLSGGGVVRAGAGSIVLSALAGPGAVGIGDDETTAASLGDIRLVDRALIDAGGSGGGSIVIRAGRLTLENEAVVSVINTGAGEPGRGISVEVDDLAIGNGARIESGTAGAGDAAAVAVRAGTLLQDGAERDFAAIQSLARAGSSGDAGNVTVSAGQIELRDGGVISGSTLGDGAAGQVSVSAGRLLIDATGSGNAGVFSRAAADSRGPGGGVTVGAQEIVVLNGGTITSSSEGVGPAGTVTVDAGTIILDGGERDFAAISSDTGAATIGDAGAVTVRANRVELRDGGNITSDTSGRGAAGSVTIGAGSVLIEGGESGFAAIQSLARSGSAGDAGDVVVSAGDLVVRDNGLISTSTLGAGDAGTVTVGVVTLLVDGGATDFAAIRSNAAQGSTGSAGAITVQVDQLRVRDGGSITSNTFGSEDAGTVRVDAVDVVIDGGESGFAAIQSLAGEGSSGDAGSVVVFATDLQLRNGGRITTSTAGAGDAGMVSVGAQTLLVDGAGQGFSRVASNAEAGSSGNAGSILVNAGAVELRSGGLITSTTASVGNGGAVGVGAGTLLIDGADTSFAAIRTSADPGSSGSAGEVRVGAVEIVVRNGGLITSSGLGQGGAGDIELFATSVTIDGAQIRTEAGAAPGGLIVIGAADLIDVADSRITTNGVIPRAGDSIITIQASTIALNSSVVTSLTGEGEPLQGSGEARLIGDLTLISVDSLVQASSSVAITGLENEIDSQLLALDGTFLDAASLIRERCAASGAAGGTFASAPSGGVAAAPADPLTGSYVGRDTTKAAAPEPGPARGVFAPTC